MAKSSSEVSKKRRRSPATTPEAREQQLISRAVDLAEKQLIEGTASAQVIVHYLKLATAKTGLENEKLKRENEFLEAKSEALKSQQRMESVYEDAIAAMRKYSGADLKEDFDEDL